MSSGLIGKTPKDAKRSEPIRISMVVIKGLLLFLIFNLLFGSIGTNSLGNFSLYNHIFPGRLRFPFGENPTEAYNFTLNNLDAMFASHVISGKATSENEFRVIVIGDSSTWGILLKPEETLSGQINNENFKCKGNIVKAYNLGYPTLSLTKDIMFLDLAMQYKPDLIIWPVTLEAFPKDKQLTSPLVVENFDRINLINNKYPLQIDNIFKKKPESNIYERSIVGQRRNLADLLRLQLYGAMWAATGIDQIYPIKYDHAQVDLSNDISFHGWTKPEQLTNGLAIKVLDIGSFIAKGIPLLVVNEPVMISSGKNSDIRYNFYYPQWAYDQYRKLLESYSINKPWRYLDLWNIVPSNEFTNSAIHLTFAGEKVLSHHIIDKIRTEFCH